MKTLLFFFTGCGAICYSLRWAGPREHTRMGIAKTELAPQMKPSCLRAAVAMIIVLVFANSISAARATDYDRLILEGKAEMERAADREASIGTREEMQVVINQYQEAANTFREAEEKDSTKPLAWFWRRGLQPNGPSN